MKSSEGDAIRNIVCGNAARRLVSRAATRTHKIAIEKMALKARNLCFSKNGCETYQLIGVVRLLVDRRRTQKKRAKASGGEAK